MTKRIQILVSGGLLVLGALILSGCGESTEPRTSAPDLPPLESMRMDLSFFGDGEQRAAASAPEGTKLNFLNAAVRAALVNVTVVTALTPPTLAFAAAVHTIPSQEGDSYIWIYTWVHEGQDYQVRLRGTPAGDHVDWELRVVLPDAEAELWFSGRSYSERDEGFWVFRDFTAPGDPEILRIDWNVVSEDDALLAFRNVQVGHEEEGDLLQYRADGSARMIIFEDFSSGEEWDIVWDGSDGSGSLRVPGYNHGERACWDSGQNDVACGDAAGRLLLE